MALHDRVGADSPVQMLPLNVFEEIFSYLKPSVLVEDEEQQCQKELVRNKLIE